MTAAADVSAADVARAFRGAIDRRRTSEEPYRWYLIEKALPASALHELATLPLMASALDGVSGKRELHNDTRAYFDAEGMARFPVMRAVAEALQSGEVVQAIAEAFDAPIDDTFLRLEYAQDIDGFWLEPHTDLGVKKFTCLLYLTEGHEDLGTDIYRNRDEYFGRSPFVPGTAMVFVPSDHTWHGFEKRPIKGVRKSVILNYVTHEWRAREQLSFPGQPVRL
jgi:hypothetical protein